MHDQHDHHPPHPSRDPAPNARERAELDRLTPTTRAILAERLKRCPLCEALNSVESPTCFVCSWAGGFESDETALADSLDRLMARCPELVDAMLVEAETRPAFGGNGVWGRLRANLARSAARLFTAGIASPAAFDLRD